MSATAPQSRDPPLFTHLIPGPPPSIYYLPCFLTAPEESLLLATISSTPLPQWRQLAHRRLQSHPSQLTAQNVLLDAPLPDWLERIAGRIAELKFEDDERGKDGQDGEDGGKGGTLFADSPHGRPNHCLVNEYLPGQGIMPHEDGPAYYPITATVSLGGQAVLVVRKKKNHLDHPNHSEADSSTQQPPPVAATTHESEDTEGESEEEPDTWRILCEPRSLLITTGDAYVSTLHAIEPVEVDEGIGIVDGDGARGVANWELLRDREGWTRVGGCRRRETRVSLTFRDVVKVKSMKAFGGVFGRRK